MLFTYLSLFTFSLSFIISTALPEVSQSGVSFISKHNSNCVAFFHVKMQMSLSSILAVHLVQELSTTFPSCNCFFNLSVVIVTFSCFAFPLSCFSTFFNHFVSLYVTGWSHILLQNLTLSWLPGLKQLCLVCLKHIALNILLCSCLIPYYYYYY